MAEANEAIHVSRNHQDPDSSAQLPYVSPLPPPIRWGLFAVGGFALLSCLASLSLLAFLCYRLFYWRTRQQSFLGYSQYVALLLNLIFADLCLAVGLVISFYWAAKNAILAPTAACTTQGFLLNVGMVASAFFVMAIGVHTFVTAALGWRVACLQFYLGIGLAWIAALILSIVGLAFYKDTYFVQTGAWCWIGPDHLGSRLGACFFWIFLSQAVVTVSYVVTFFKLRRRASRLVADPGHASHQLANENTVHSVNRVTKLMMLYPVVYMVLTLPQCLSRMWSMAHDGRNMDDISQVGVGAVLASCGWVNCLLYTLTRKRLMKEIMGGDENSTDGFQGLLLRMRSHAGLGPKKTEHGIRRTTIVTVHRDGFDASSGKPLPPSLVYTEVWAGESRDPMTAERRLAEHPVHERPPSQEEFVMAGFARYGGVVAIPDGPSTSRVAEQPRRPRHRELVPKSQAGGDSSALV